MAYNQIRCCFVVAPESKTTSLSLYMVMLLQLNSTWSELTDIRVASRYHLTSLNSPFHYKTVKHHLHINIYSFTLCYRNVILSHRLCNYTTLPHQSICGMREVTLAP